MASDYVTKLIEQAKRSEEGSAEYESALSSLREWNAKNAKKANSRLRALEAGNMERYAYTRAIGFVREFGQSNAFKGGKALTLSDEDLIDQVREIDTFLGRKTSTLRGAQAMEKSRGEYLSETFGIEVPRHAQAQFYRFLGTDSVSTFLKDVSGFYKTVVEGVANVFATASDRAKLREELTDAIDEYLSGGKRYDVLMKELGVNINDLRDA